MGRRGDGKISALISPDAIAVGPFIPSRFLAFFSPRRHVAPSPHLFTRLSALFEQGKNLDRLPQSHIVRQTPAESKLPQEVYPAQAVFLVWSQFPVEFFWRFGGPDAFKSLQFVAGAGEGLIEIGFGLGAEERVEHADLRLAEAQVVFARLTESREQ